MTQHSPRPIPATRLTPQLTPTQQAILRHAIAHTGGCIAWFPDTLKGGARQKVIDGLFKRAWITPDGQQGWCVAAEGYDALGVQRPCLQMPAANSAPNHSSIRKTRPNSKQAQVIAMLQRPEGASIAQIMQATGWQQHTVRGFFAGALQKRLCLALASEKIDGVRMYRVA